MDDDAAKRLDAIRKRIDALDEQLIELLASRMALVSEVAEVKRGGRMRIRDVGRERAILEGRKRSAEARGLSPAVTESLFRLILLSSRDRQAALKVESPPDVERRRVAIVGGKGGMGRLFHRMLEELGHEVEIVDEDTQDQLPTVAARADVVLISVPIAVTEQVIARVGPMLRDDALLVDVTSLKEGPMHAMLAATKASVVGTHPMFGPSVNTLIGQRVVVCKGRGDAWHAWALATFRARGLVVVETTPEAHDRAMAVVQVLNHFQTQVLGWTLARLGTPLDESLAFSSPAYLLETYVAARHFAQSPDLYGPIEMENPRRSEITRAFKASVIELAEILDAKDLSRFRAMFDEVRAFFGPFTDEALEQSRHLIDRLVELTAGRIEKEPR